MKRLIFILGIVVMFVFSLSSSNVLAQPGNQCEANYNLDYNMDAADITKFLEDFGRNVFSNPCPEPPLDGPPFMTKYERMFCEASPDCWVVGYEFTQTFNSVCCCWDQTMTYNYGCRGSMYCEFDLQGMCF
jgi:hypothetical protein